MIKVNIKGRNLEARVQKNPGGKAKSRGTKRSDGNPQRAVPVKQNTESSWHVGARVKPELNIPFTVRRRSWSGTTVGIKTNSFVPEKTDDRLGQLLGANLQLAVC